MGDGNGTNGQGSRNQRQERVRPVTGCAHVDGSRIPQPTDDPGRQGRMNSQSARTYYYDDENKTPLDILIALSPRQWELVAWLADAPGWKTWGWILNRAHAAGSLRPSPVALRAMLEAGVLEQTLPAGAERLPHHRQRPLAHYRLADRFVRAARALSSTEARRRLLADVDNLPDGQ